MAGAGAMDVVEYAPLIDSTKNTGTYLLLSFVSSWPAGPTTCKARNRPSLAIEI
jgi:hypothetical protein